MVINDTMQISPQKALNLILRWQFHPFFDDVQRRPNVSVSDQRLQL
jgi:hypothetical protein